MKVPLLRINIRDERICAFTSHGNYSIRTRYMFGFSILLHPHNSCWELIWNSNVPLKIKHFL